MNQRVSEIEPTKAPLNDEQIREFVDAHTWYQPVSLGNGIYTTPVTGAHDIFSPGLGLAKWNYIIERNLPDLQGLRVLDIGCNSGVMSLQMARAGAREVVGVDSTRTWAPWLEQATFVKRVLEQRCRTTYNIHYVDAEMTDIPQLELGEFDVVIALCSIYYISDADIHRLLKFFHDSGVGHVLLQANHHPGNQTAEVRRRAKLSYLADQLRNAGYPYVGVDKPLFYNRPLAVGRIAPFEQRRLTKRETFRAWLRRHI